MANLKTSLAKIVIAAAIDTTGTSATITALQETFDAIRSGMGRDDRKRLDDLAEEVRGGVEDSMKAFARADGARAENVEAASSQAEMLLRSHALRPSELMTDGMEPADATKRVFGKGARLVSTMGAPVEGMCRTIVESVYGVLLNRAEVMRELEPAYRRAVLAHLKELPGDSARELLRLKAEWDLLRDPVSTYPISDLPMSHLLRSGHRVVGFTGREAIEQNIVEWCEADTLAAVRLYTGQGGIGKTRLLIEACETQRCRGWRVGFLAAMTSPPETHAVRALLGSLDPLFLVVDYAETRRTDLIPILREAALPDPARAKIRIVLLARGVQDWWGELQGDDADAGLLLHDDVAGRFELPPVADGRVEREAAYRQAVEDFAEARDKTAPAAAPPDLGAEHFESVLFIHLAALAHVEGERLEGADELLDFILAHERRYWAGALHDEGLSNGLAGAIGQVVALATLAGGIDDRADVDAFLRRVPLLGGETAATRDSIGRIARRIYPERYGLAEIRPDLIGEHLVDRQLADHPALLDTAINPEATPAQTTHALTVLTRLAQRKPESANLLERALSGDLELLAEAAMDVAVETGDPIGRVLAKSLSDRPDSALAKTIESKVPEQTVALRELAVAAGSICRDHLNAHPDPKSEQLLTEMARINNNLGNRLSALGRREDALEATEEAVAIYRRLAEVQPDAFLPDLAVSFNNLGGMLSELGRREDALEATEEAVAIRRRLAEARPDAFLSDLAVSLNNLGGRLSALGRREDALEATEEAVAFYRRLAEARPDAFLPDLAVPLNNLGATLSVLGRREDALEAIEEAVTIYRRLAEARPDSFLPDLAMSLNNLGATLSALGRREDALEAIEEAVAIRRRLAEARPDAFLPDLAASLNNLGATLSGLGQHEEALETTEEAVAIYQGLAQIPPDIVVPDLARSLLVLGDCLAALDRSDEALSAIQEAISGLSPMFLSEQNTYRNRMARLLQRYTELAEEVGHDLDMELIGPASEMLAQLQGDDGDEE